MGTRPEEVGIGMGTAYTWEPWGISFDLPSGLKVGKVGDEMLVVNETGVLPDGDVPQMKVYLKKNTTLAAVEASYEKEENFSRSEALINDHRVTTVNYDDGFAGPDTAYLVQIDNNVMEYRLAHAVGTAGYEHDDLVADVVLRSLNF